MIRKSERLGANPSPPIAGQIVPAFHKPHTAMAIDLIEEFNTELSNRRIRWRVEKVTRPFKPPVFDVVDNYGQKIQTFESFTELKNALLPFVSC